MSFKIVTSPVLLCKKTPTPTMSTFEVDVAEPISADQNVDQSDADSAVGGSGESTYTESLRSSLLESLRENGRGYHKCLYAPALERRTLCHACSAGIVIRLLTVTQTEAK